jgi:prepilin-type N-terminal cleavage/methylation domain-containing protein
MLKKRLRNQKGFTLIEIIAVLVILGILAAVAIPKFLGLQDDAKKASARGAVASAQSAISMGYAQYLLNPTAPAYAGPAAACGNISFDSPTGVTYSVACTGTAWTTTYSTITGTYDGQTATGRWSRP